MMYPKNKVKIELFNDNFQNFKRYGIPKAQLVIADIPYNLGNNAYGSSPEWYKFWGKYFCYLVPMGTNQKSFSHCF